MENLKRQCACNGVGRLCAPIALLAHALLNRRPRVLFIDPSSATLAECAEHHNVPSFKVHSNCNSASRVVVILTMECGYVMRSVRPVRIFVNCLIYHLTVSHTIRYITANHIHSCVRNLHQLPIAVANKYCGGCLFVVVVDKCKQSIWNADGSRVTGMTMLCPQLQSNLN